MAEIETQTIKGKIWPGLAEAVPSTPRHARWGGGSPDCNEALGCLACQEISRLQVVDELENCRMETCSW